ncbi:RNA polymerase subunit sigma [Streptomyces sp. NPDC052492]|uniref:RNA polymerase subunit sigma n=1 Tax=unclassified Streptomyces TaxID=2593676 RepID=UPI0037D05C4F
MSRIDDGLPIADLLDERRQLVAMAHWLLGSGREAESAVDECYRRWYGLSDDERERIGTPRSWLAGVVGDLCLSRLALPDRDGGLPGPESGPEERPAGLRLSALDSLTPAERAALVLDDVLGTTRETVAEVRRLPDTGPATPADEAERVVPERPVRSSSARQHDVMAHAVRRACAEEDEALLASLLAPDATAVFDGGGKVRTLVGPVHGDAQVARSVLRLLARHPRTTLDTHSVNGRTGLVVRYEQQVAAVISLDVADHHVVQVWVVLNPDKLRSFNPGRP